MEQVCWEWCWCTHVYERVYKCVRIISGKFTRLGWTWFPVLVQGHPDFSIFFKAVSSHQYLGNFEIWCIPNTNFDCVNVLFLHFG